MRNFMLKEMGQRRELAEKISLELKVMMFEFAYPTKRTDQ